MRDDIAGVVKTCHRVKQAGALLKVIIEMALLTDDEKRLACELAKDAGADFVKTLFNLCASVPLREIAPTVAASRQTLD